MPNMKHTRIRPLKPKPTRNTRQSLIAVLTGALLGAGAFAADAPLPATSPASTFARVGDIVITQQDYDTALAVAARRNFHHSTEP